MRGEWPCHVYIPISPTAHLSLSKPFTLSSHEIISLVHLCSRQVCCCVPFDVITGSHGVLQSKEHHGVWFAVTMCVLSPALSSLLDSVDAALAAFGRQEYYQERLVHVSLAKGDSEGDMRALVDLKDKEENVVLCRAHVIVLKAGHRVFHIPLGGGGSWTELLG